MIKILLLIVFFVNNYALQIDYASLLKQAQQKYNQYNTQTRTWDDQENEQLLNVMTMLKSSQALKEQIIKVNNYINNINTYISSLNSEDQSHIQQLIAQAHKIIVDITPNIDDSFRNGLSVNQGYAIDATGNMRSQAVTQLKKVYDQLSAFVEKIELSSTHGTLPINVPSDKIHQALSLIKEPLDLLTKAQIQTKQTIVNDYYPQIIKKIDLLLATALNKANIIQRGSGAVLQKAGINIVDITLKVCISCYIAHIKKAYDYYKNDYLIDVKHYDKWHFFITEYVNSSKNTIDNLIAQSQLQEEEKKKLTASYRSEIASIVIPLCAQLLTKFCIEDISSHNDCTNCLTIEANDLMHKGQFLFDTVQYYNQFLMQPLDIKRVIANMTLFVERINNSLLLHNISSYNSRSQTYRSMHNLSIYDGNNITPILKAIDDNYTVLMKYTADRKYTLCKDAIQRIQNALKGFDPDDTSPQALVTCTQIIDDLKIINYTNAESIFLESLRNILIKSELTKENQLVASLIDIDDVINIVPEGPLENPFNAVGAFKDIQTNISALIELTNHIQQSSNNSVFTNKKSIQSFDNYAAITTFFNDCSSFFRDLGKCVTTAQLGTSEALDNAETLYTKLVAQAQIIDTMKSSIITRHHPFVEKMTSFSYKECLAVFVARCYVWTATTSLNSSLFLLNMRYYVAARSKSGLLPTALNGIINNYFLKVSSQSNNITDLMNTIKQKHSAFMNASCQKMSGNTYENDFSTMADTLLHLCWIAYCWGQKQALDYFTDAAGHYLEGYAQCVSANSMRQAKYISIVNVYALMLESTHQNKKIEPLINKYLAHPLEEYTLYANQLTQALLTAKRITNRSLTPKDAKNALNDLSLWQQSTNWLLSEQTKNNAIYSQSNKLKRVYIVRRKVLPNGQTSFAFYGSRNVVHFPSMLDIQVSAYQKVADQAFNQQDYQTAQRYYKKVSSAYTSLGQTDKAKAAAQSMAQAKTLYYAHYYASLVAPQGNVTIGNFNNIPLSYTITAYEQVVPNLIAQALPPAQSITDKQELDKLAIATALKVFIFNSLTAQYSTQDAQAEYKNLQGALQNQGIITQTDDPTISVILTNAQQLQKTITNTTPPVLEGIKTTLQGQNAYKLWEYNVPIDAIPLQTAPYVTYPNAFNYYNLACLLYGPQAVHIGGTLMTPANKPAQQQAMKNNALNAWLSHGYQSQIAINNLRQSSLYQQIQKESTTNISLKLSDFEKLFTQIYNFYGPLEQKSTQQYPLWVSYAIPLNNSLKLIDPASTQYKNLVNLVGMSYKNAADDLSVFLKGDPLSSTYNRFLKIIVSYYQAAIEQGYDKALYGVIGDLYSNVGTLLQSNKNDFSALSYFENAHSYYQKINSPKMHTTHKNIIFCQATTAIQQLSAYALIKQHPLNYTDDEGTNHTISFSNLMSNYLTAINQDSDLDDAQQTLVTNAQNTLLNALIVLSSLGAQSPAAKTVRYNASSKQLNDYMKNNAINLSDQMHIQAFFMNNNIKDLCMHLFKNALQKNDTDSVFLWASKLYNAGMLLYMYDFLGGVSSNSFESLNNAIGARAAAIQMNPALAIG